nr:hypothetical protein CFP56_11790 [Quercus suber]
MKSVHERYLETGSIDETKRVLDATPSQIGELFNSVLADPLAYPLVLAGGRLLRDPSILLLLILLLLGVPFEHINQAVTAVFDEVASNPRPYDIEVNGFQEFLATRKEWVNAIREHIDVEHAGIVTYLCKVGVSSDSMAAIKEILGTEVGEKQLIDVSVQEDNV